MIERLSVRSVQAVFSVCISTHGILDLMRILLPFNIVAVIFLWSWSAKAKVNWIVVPVEDNRFVLEHAKDKSLRHDIVGQGIAPKYMGLHRVKERNIALLIYFSGSAGTGEVVSIYRTVVFNTKSKKFYGDFPFRVESSKKRWPDTVFTFHRQNFTVEDASTGLKKTIPY